VEVFSVHAADPEAELAADALWAAGVAGVEERSVGDGTTELVAGFGPGVPDGAARIAAAVAGRWEVSVQPVDAAAWMDAWRPWARCTRVAGVVLHPPWVPLEASPDDVVVELEPGHAWGHGGHPSTVLAAELVVRAGLADRRVLDVGCGSGALSLVAAVGGAAQVVAIDVDPEARRATAANAARNGLAEHVSVLDVGLDAVGEVFDLVTANLGVGVLAQLTDRLLDRVAPEGAGVVVSGLLEGQRTWSDDVVELDRAVADGWAAVRIRRV